MAQYTGMRLAERAARDVVDVGLKRRAEEDGIVASFAYTSGPLYGYLLDAVREAWRKDLTRGSDLGAMLAAAHRIEPQ
ncbi:MAG: hypothetical protein O7F76_14125, partial [Planctomycetota bacterium]|nr:hypothetical protein [Planctomycetota bacterium]